MKIKLPAELLIKLKFILDDIIYTNFKSNVLMKFEAYRCDNFRSVLNGTDQADHDENNVKEICYDWSPHVTEEVKDLLLYDGHLKMKH